jgi:[glutamine synthetase] adenylyltransferase / [glutamine synthetase]-adenylyl-L-tyrosine phosphorylase
MQNSETIQLIKRCSPYLTQLVFHHPSLVDRLGVEPSEKILDELCATLRNHEFQKQTLRQQKSKAALLIAYADVSGEWDVVQVTKALTKFADASVVTAVNYVLRQAATKNKIELRDDQNPGFGCGYVVLAMGKHGAGELNYSSDIDLIILYDSETAPLAEGVEPSTFFVRLTRDLVALLQDITEDGYGFRVDLRLRPDPRATQVAISMEAAAIYYENQGQNWERAAMIKSRAVAGDIALGVEFLNRLKPYIWRKYLDFAAIADVQSMKRQIHAVKGHSEITVRGHDVKLGRGGIREIEFFVQTQQLIAGGRNQNLRGNRTLEMLGALAAEKWITRSTAHEMQVAYCFLRMVEHRAQMVDDQQTHIVPSNAEAFEKFSEFSGFKTSQAFSEKLEATLQTVQRHYAALFESAGELSGEVGSLVFTGGEDDPATIMTLQTLGFKQASEVSATIRGWHFGRYVAMRTARAREMLTELTPVLLKALAETGEPDSAFLSFDQFLKGLPIGIQFLAMIKAHPNLLNLIALALGAAPRLAEHLSKQPRILEALVAPGFFSSNETTESLRTEINASIEDQSPLDEAMDQARIFAREHQFKIGMRQLSETLDAGNAGHSYSIIAGTIIEKILTVARSDIEKHHGKLSGGHCAIVALGKLGGLEMTAASDLDLMLVYDCDDEEFSTGPKQLSPTQYFAKLTQRFVTALTAQTAEGGLYEVDLRLRPSGSKGPVAVSFASFVDYQKNSAWTWEMLALTRARSVAGDPAFIIKLNAVIGDTLQSARNAVKIKSDVSTMRALMVREHNTQDIWDIKKIHGGLVDIEFIAQYMQLIHAHKHPDILSCNTPSALQNAKARGVLSAKNAESLIAAYALYYDLTQILRLCIEGPFNPNKAPKKLIEILCRAVKVPDLSSAEATLRATQTSISNIFEELIGR